jgi:hypothetical protein
LLILGDFFADLLDDLFAVSFVGRFLFLVVCCCLMPVDRGLMMIDDG